MCSDLFVAGQETTSTTLSWGIAYLIHNQEVQRHLHEELDRVVASDRLITMADKAELHYTNAVVAVGDFLPVGHACGRLLGDTTPLQPGAQQHLPQDDPRRDY